MTVDHLLLHCPMTTYFIVLCFHSPRLAWVMPKSVYDMLESWQRLYKEIGGP